LKEIILVLNETFDYDELQINADGIQYKDIHAKTYFC
jgi:hypothetical protein